MPDESQFNPIEFALGERLAFLERHVQQQDREVYAQSEQIRRLQQEVQTLREQLRGLRAQAPQQEDMPGDERPPHY